MSSPHSEPGGAKREHAPQQPGARLIAFGVAYPAAVIVIATIFSFDPKPTYWHTLAVGLVPASNLVVWANLRDGAPLGVKSLAFANGVAIAIAGFHAFASGYYVHLPLTLLSIINFALVIWLEILAMAPLAAFLCAMRLRVALCERDPNHTSFRSLLRGLATGIAVLLVLYVPPIAM